MRGAARLYTIHGLTLRLDGDLPVGEDARPDARPDIIVHARARPAWAAADLDPSGILYRAAPGDTETPLIDVGAVAGGLGLRMRFAEGATYWISATLDEIWVEFVPPLAPEDAAYFLLEPVLAFVLRRRGELVLHASAVSVGGRAVAFCGPSGTGKSTIAAACVAGGAGLVSDDVVAVTPGDGCWIAHRGGTAIRLWDDGVGTLGERARPAPRFSGTWDKRVVTPTLLAGQLAPLATPLAMVCLLGADADAAGDKRQVTLDPLRGMHALRALLPNTAARYLHDTATRARELEQLAAIAADLPIVRLCAPPGRAGVAAVLPALESALRG